MVGDSSLADSLLVWKETYNLSCDLAEISYIILNKFADYCRKNNVPFCMEQTIVNLMNKSRSIIKEIETINSPNFNLDPIRRKKTCWESDGEEPESKIVKLIY